MIMIKKGGQMRNIILFLVLYTFSSNLSVASTDFELSDVIKQARQSMISENKNNNIKEANNTSSSVNNQANTEQINSKSQYSPVDNICNSKKEQ